MSILSVDQLKQSSPSSMVDGTFNYIKADYNFVYSHLLFFNDPLVRSFQNPTSVLLTVDLLFAVCALDKDSTSCIPFHCIFKIFVKNDEQSLSLGSITGFKTRFFSYSASDFSFAAFSHLQLLNDVSANQHSPLH